MIGQSLSNTNETCYSVQIAKICNLNKALDWLSNLYKFWAVGIWIIPGDQPNGPLDVFNSTHGLVGACSAVRASSSNWNRRRKKGWARHHGPVAKGRISVAFMIVGLGTWALSGCGLLFHEKPATTSSQHFIPGKSFFKGGHGLSKKRGHAACSAGAKMIIYDRGLLLLAGLVWEKNIVLAENLRSFTTKRTGRCSPFCHWLRQELLGIRVNRKIWGHPQWPCSFLL